jgi:hypothetical protein
MAGLLDYLSNLKFEPDAKSMGLMNMGADMLAASGYHDRPVGFGETLGAGLHGFNQGYMAQKNHEESLAAAEQKKLLDAADINYKNAQANYYNAGGSGATPGPYMIPAGAVEETFGSQKGYRLKDGSFIPAIHGLTEYQYLNLDPVRQQQIAAAKEGVKTNPVEMSDGSKIPMTNSQANPNYNYGGSNQANQLSPLELEIKQKIESGQMTQEQGIAILQQNAAPGLAPNASGIGIGQSTESKYNQQKTGEINGEAQAKAQIDLPGSLAASEQLSKLTNEISTHPGLPGVVGMPNFWGAMPFPGTKEADFKARLEQLKGTAFLQAFEKLKGGGAVSEREGQQATAALARLQTSQTEKEFKNSLQDFNNVMAGVTDRLKVRANGGVQQPQAPQSQPSIDDLVNHYGAK